MASSWSGSLGRRRMRRRPSPAVLLAALASSALAVDPAAASSAAHYPGNPLIDTAAPERCGGLAQADKRFGDGSLKMPFCDPNRIMARSLMHERSEAGFAANAAHHFEGEFSLDFLGVFGAQGAVALVGWTKEPLPDFADAVAWSWGFNTGQSFLLALRGGDQPGAAIVGPLLEAPWAALAPRGWREALERRATAALAIGRPGLAVKEALLALADAYAGSPGLGVPSIAGSSLKPHDVKVVRVQSNFQLAHLETAVCSEKLCKALYLDEVRQITSGFEGYYHESLAMPALNILANRPGRPPKRVLILGGGDGGAATKCLMFDSVERVVLLDIDGSVSELARRELPGIARAFWDPRLTAKHVDAFAWLAARRQKAKEFGGFFDLVIIDFTDNPIKSFWSTSIFVHLRDVLVDDGILVHNVGCLGGPEGFRNSLRLHQRVFAQTFVMNTLVPDYSTNYYLGLSSKAEIDPRAGNWTYWAQQNIATQYYSSDLHAELFYMTPEVAGSVFAPLSFEPAPPEKTRFPRTLALEGLDENVENYDWPSDPWNDVEGKGTLEVCSRDDDATGTSSECSEFEFGTMLYNAFDQMQQESCVYAAMNILGRRARRVLILGDPSLTIVSSVLRYQSVERVSLIESDQAAVAYVKKSLSDRRRAAKDPRLSIAIGDALEMIPSLLDASDVEGPERIGFDLIFSTLEHMSWEAPSRFTRVPQTIPFGLALKKLLQPHGLLLHDAGSLQHLSRTKRMVDMVRVAFQDGSVWPMHLPLNYKEEVYRAPAFFVLASPSVFDPNDVDWQVWKEVNDAQTGFYAASVHALLFVLPMEIQRMLNAPPPVRRLPSGGADDRDGTRVGSSSVLPPPPALGPRPIFEDLAAFFAEEQGTLSAGAAGRPIEDAKTTTTAAPSPWSEVGAFKASSSSCAAAAA